MTKKNKKERTINDVYNLVGDFFVFVKDQFGKIETRFEKNERVLKLMSEGMVSIGKEVRELKDTTEKMHGRLRNVEQDVLIVREDVETLGKLMGRDSSRLKSHERRITNLERSRFL
jgi:hypothetical protein